MGIKKLRQQIDEIREDDFSWVIQVDGIEHKNGKLILEGFAFELEKDSERGGFEIVLHNLDTGEYKYPKMEYLERNDVNKYFQCEYDYAMSGFIASIDEDKLDLAEFDYEVLLRPEWKEPYQFETYLSNGELFHTNPKVFESLDVEGTSLEKIVREGILRMYRKDYGMYVYQFEGDMYWITDSKQLFTNNDMYVEYHWDTTQREKFLQEQLNNQRYWDMNMSFWFRKNEVENEKYRVTKEKLPSEYAIWKMWTGHYDEGWVWIEYFRPFYQFSGQ